MSIIKQLSGKWESVNHPFLVHPSNDLYFADILKNDTVYLSSVEAGDVVALIGDFEPQSIAALLNLVDKGAIVVPLTEETSSQHEYFFEQACVHKVLKDGAATEISARVSHPLIDELRNKGNAGLVLFSTGTTGKQKAILHDFTRFLKRFETPRPTLRTLSFLLFDHIGGLNTLLHTLYNRGVVISPVERTVDSVLKTCAQHDVEVLPTTPTFLRMMLMSGKVPKDVPDSLRIITYGTERMDQPTLDDLCRLLPNVDFRQTFGMSELGIVRVKSEARDSLFMRIGGEGVETKVVDGVLQIRSDNRMLGYLNAPSPFDVNGWYDTKDVVEERDGLYKVVGRQTEVINVGGQKFMASEVESAAMAIDGVQFARAEARDNPITGQHVQLTVSLPDTSKVEPNQIKNELKSRLPRHMVPSSVRVGKISMSHRHKRQ